MKYIFVTGGVCSSLGKGILASSIGAVLKVHGYSIRIKKMDPYLNVDPGTMSPYEHGEVFVTEDGGEADLDLGHYERFTGINALKTDSISAGKIYQTVLEKERKGDYLGQTIQVIPHVTEQIKQFIINNHHDEDFLICEIGGTVGDIEATPFLEAVRQFANDQGRSHVLFVHLTLLPYLPTTGELKTKPTQHSVRELQSIGIFPDILVCRSSFKITDDELRKISLFCNLKLDNVIPCYDAKSIYSIPANYITLGLDKLILTYFGMYNSINIDNSSVNKWYEIDQFFTNNNLPIIKLALIGKYNKLQDAYKSIIEAIQHSSFNLKLKVEIVWYHSSDLEHKSDAELSHLFQDIDGILVAPGFGTRGSEGKICAIRYAREHDIPFLGICFGMQLAVIEFARNVLHIQNAHSSELSSYGTFVVSLITEWTVGDQCFTRDANQDLGGTLRLGSYPCVIEKDTLAFQLYKQDHVAERHRHRYEINFDYKEQLANKGAKFSGMSPDGKLCEIFELTNHRWFLAVQFHPEFSSKIFNSHPVFDGFLTAMHNYNQYK